MQEEKRSEISPVKVKPSRHDEWILAALLAAGLFQAGTAIHQMNRMARHELELQSGSEQASVPQPAQSVSGADKGALLATTAGNRHHS